MIKIENLSVAFDGMEVVKNITIEIADGEIVGVVGESGSGKSVTALTLMGLGKEDAVITSGRILFDNIVLAEAGKSKNKALYRKYQGNDMSMIFQEPMTSLNPTKRAGIQVEEVLKLHTKLSKKERKQKVLETFSSVGLKNPEKVYSSYPHQLSGGMRQRVMIAMAIILKPKLLVADEPTTALDVTVQNQIIGLLKEINEQQKNAMLFITHDLNLARRICNRIVVMKSGMIVEQGETEVIFESPKENYTKHLMEAVPKRIKKKAEVTKSANVSASLKKLSKVSREEDEKAGFGGQSYLQMSIKNNTQKIVNDRCKNRYSEEILRVEHLDVFYPKGDNSLFSKKEKHHVVKDATFSLYKGEVLGLVGESGCGKTSLSKAVLGINRDTKGLISHEVIRPQMIFQDPYSSLNPTKSIGWLLEEPLRAAGKLDKTLIMSEVGYKIAACEMLKKIGLNETFYDRTPSQLSGGQRQRVSIGQALITKPAFIVADEPVSALDVTIQAQIMELMQKFQEEMKLSYLFISHDINVVYQMCDRVMVMKDGCIIEIGDTEEVFQNPKEEYTKLLLANS